MSVNRYKGSSFNAAGEFNIVSQKGVTLNFKNSSHSNENFKKSGHKGIVHLTNRKFIFVSKDYFDFSTPFSMLSDFDIKQPIFGANKLTGRTRGEPGECGFLGTVDWEMVFNEGGAIEFGQLMQEFFKKYAFVIIFATNLEN